MIKKRVFFVTWVAWAASQLQRRICLVSMGIVWIHPPTPQWSKCWRGDRVSNGLRDTTSRSICMDQNATQVGFLPFRQTWQRNSFHWVRWFPAKKPPHYLWRCAENHTLDQSRILILSADKYADGLFVFCVIQRQWQRVYIYIIIYKYQEMRQHHWRGFRIFPCKGLQVSDFGPYCLKKCLRIICLRRSAELRFQGIRWAQSYPNHKIKVSSHLKVKTPCLMAKSTSVIVQIVCSDVLFVDKLML